MNAGDRVGRWTLISPAADGRWLCRCDCGTERAVLERSLRHGGSLSCGCLARQRAGEKTRRQLEGQTFGKLTVTALSPQKAPNGGLCWECLCECGNTCTVPGSLLTGGKRTSCGCDAQYAFADITGRTFHRLTALHPLPDRDKTGSVMWHCRCECGNETNVSYNNLMYGNTRSCGCRKKEHEQVLHSYLTHVDGTSVDMLKSKKLPRNNTTGVKGVYLIKGRYVAKIVFQKKQYFLGTFDNLEDAKAAREDAEAQINDEVVTYYQRWRMLADADPEWAREHPMQISVSHDAHGRIRLLFQPSLPWMELEKTPPLAQEIILAGTGA